MCSLNPTAAARQNCQIDGCAAINWQQAHPALCLTDTIHTLVCLTSRAPLGVLDQQSALRRAWPTIYAKPRQPARRMTRASSPWYSVQHGISHLDMMMTSLRKLQKWSYFTLQFYPPNRGSKWLYKGSFHTCRTGVSKQANKKVRPSFTYLLSTFRIYNITIDLILHQSLLHWIYKVTESLSILWFITMKVFVNIVKRNHYHN